MERPIKDVSVSHGFIIDPVWTTVPLVVASEVWGARGSEAMRVIPLCSLAAVASGLVARSLTERAASLKALVRESLQEGAASPEAMIRELFDWSSELAGHS